MSLYACDHPACEWTNPGWRWSMADAGAEWASHMSEHRAEVES